MAVIELYLIFALATGISCTAIFLWPALRLAKQANIDNELTRAPITALVVYAAISTAIAPVLVVPLFSKQAGEAFWEATKHSALEPSEKNQ
jgi:hypothetical protein